MTCGKSGFLVALSRRLASLWCRFGTYSHALERTVRPPMSTSHNARSLGLADARDPLRRPIQPLLCDRCSLLPTTTCSGQAPCCPLPLAKKCLATFGRRTTATARPQVIDAQGRLFTQSKLSRFNVFHSIAIMRATCIAMPSLVASLMVSQKLLK